MEALRSLNMLDTPPEERFDRLTRMAKRLFGVPVALVSLVDEERQWFKSNIGLNIRETSRDDSFCGHAILGEDAFVINDAKSDARFADNPLVLGDPNFRFYAGIPLRTADNLKLGTLCIVDYRPRELEPEDVNALGDLAAMASEELNAVKLATLDELTGISNRRGFMKLGRYCIAYSNRHKIPASLVFMDLNKFKPINDNFGHAEGDRALVTFADLMKQTFRTSDLVARLGGDEFAVLLVNSNKALTEELIGRFRESLDKINQERARGYEIAFSAGIVEFDPDRHSSIDALLKEGDKLMYAVKQGGR